VSNGRLTRSKEGNASVPVVENLLGVATFNLDGLQELPSAKRDHQLGDSARF
jgi:hypothetical protein